jgi:hypothetical protein
MRVVDAVVCDSHQVFAMRAVPTLSPRCRVFGAALAVAATLPAQTPFQRSDLAWIAGDVKLCGDIDLDGTNDIVVAGGPAEGLSFFHFPSWWQTRIATPTVEFTTDGALGDVDGDGDLDIVVPDGPSGVNLWWFENPTRPGGDPFVGSSWRQHAIGAIGSWGKDVELADFDGDGRLDVATRQTYAVLLFLQTAPWQWTSVAVPVASIGDEGLLAVDLDGDADHDLVVRGAWLANPGGALALDPGRWRERAIDPSGAVSPTFKVAAGDLDGDGAVDLLFSSSEGLADVAWYRHAGDPTGAWQRRVIAPSVFRAHTLEVADLDADGAADVVVGQMHTSTERELVVHYNADRRGTAWSAQVVDRGAGIHNGVVADIGGDGDLDIVGANWTGNPPLRLWENTTPTFQHVLTVEPLVSGLTARITVTNARPGATVVVCTTAAGSMAPYAVPGWNAEFALREPLFLRGGLVRPNGAVVFEVGVPWLYRGIDAWFQAIEPGRSSNVVGDSIR